MPSLADIVSVAESLQGSPIAVLPSRCVAVRNRNATCRRCEETCIADAVTVGENQVSIDAALCVNCGACVGACPGSALVGAKPLAEDVALQASRAMAACDGVAVIACARKAARKTGDPERFAELPCLGRLTEAALVALACQGAKQVYLVDGDCATCRYGAAEPAIDAAVQGAATLLGAWGLPVPFERASEFPPCVQAGDGQSVRAAERRRLFARAGSMAKSAARTAAEQALDEVLAQSKQRTLQTLRDRMRAPGGVAAPFEPERNLAVLDALCARGEPDGRPISTRLYGSVSIDAQTCSGCGVCLLACPTRALRRSEVVEADDPQQQMVEFQAADCIQCGLCADVCLRGSVTVSPTVSSAELVDFEPRLMAIPRQMRGGALFRKAYESRRA